LFAFSPGSRFSGCLPLLQIHIALSISLAYRANCATDTKWKAESPRSDSL